MFAGQGMIAQSCLGAFIGTLEVGWEGRVRVCCHMPKCWRLKDVTNFACWCLRHECIGFAFEGADHLCLSFRM